MGKYKIEVKPIAEKHLKEHLKSGDKASIKKIEKIFLELSENPLEGIGNPEQLKYELSGFWSRKINTKDRLIYYVEDMTVIVYVISAKGHYLDK
jgi:toxin YoeB